MDLILNIRPLQVAEVLRWFGLDEHDLLPVWIVKTEKFAQIFSIRSFSLVRRKLEELNRDLHFNIVESILVTIGRTSSAVSPASYQVTPVAWEQPFVSTSMP